ncbi:hypothetical protein ACFWPH_01965 [Nocardia sp. NPDC058499]|uniref:hypothetical protein n=1 Tax=Nocardia sp. NPDC058499 TaxID=3346530 RepID=UPI00364FFCF8
MTVSPHGSGDQPQGHWPQEQLPPPAYPPQPAGRGPSWLILVGAAGAAVVVLVIGVVAGVILGGRNDDSVPTAIPEPAIYSMKAVTNACDLVDPTPLTRWASTPGLDPVDELTRSSGDFGNLRCSFYYDNSTRDEFPMNTATMRVWADVMDGSAARKYDHCIRTAAELADTGSEVTSGKFTGIGTRGYWQFEADNFGGIVDADYGLCVLDGGVAVRVRIELSLEKDSPAVGRDELDSVARAQARTVLDGLRQN